MENDIIEKDKIENDENQFPKEVNDILSIIYNFFTEENVDCVKNLDNYRIIVRFPKVTVTNEKDEATDVKDLYVKFIITSEYKILYNFTMVTTTFTESKWIVGYAHSHLPIISTGNIGFKEPCFGRGPITNTIRYLNNHYDLDYWEMFCLELKRYVETESLTGVPYIRLNSISSNNAHYKLTKGYTINFSQLSFKTDDIHYLLQPLIDNFVDFLLLQKSYFDNVIKIANNNGCFVIGEDLVSCNIKITNLFIKYIKIYLKDYTLTNEELKENLFIECGYRNSRIYTKNIKNSINSVPKTPILKFKNEYVFVKIIKDERKENIYNLLNKQVFSYILTNFLIKLNNKNEFSEKQFSII